jgi:hypothetical protein
MLIRQLDLQKDTYLILLLGEKQLIKTRFCELNIASTPFRGVFFWFSVNKLKKIKRV